MARKTKKEFREVPFELPGDVTVTVKYPKDARPPMFLFDTYVIIGQQSTVEAASSFETSFNRAAVESARAALALRHPNGPTGSASGMPSATIVSPQSLGFEPMTPESLSGGGEFAGVSNEDTDA